MSVFRGSFSRPRGSSSIYNRIGMSLNIPNPTSNRMHCNPRFISFFLRDENVDDFRFLNRFLFPMGNSERERERKSMVAR